jgi:hypothetical protein
VKRAFKNVRRCMARDQSSSTSIPSTAKVPSVPLALSLSSASLDSLESTVYSHHCPPTHRRPTKKGGGASKRTRSTTKGRASDAEHTVSASLRVGISVVCSIMLEFVFVQDARACCTLPRSLTPNDSKHMSGCRAKGRGRVQ